MPKPELKISAQRIEQYDALVATKRGVPRKGATMPYTSVNGNMFSFLSPDGALALRLAKDDRDSFIAAHDTRLFMDRGAALSEYVVVPEPLWKRPAQLAKHFAASYAYARTLKAKPTKRPTKKRAG